MDHLDHLDRTSNGAGFSDPGIPVPPGSHGSALLAEAFATGITLRLAGDTVKVGGNPSPEFLARLRAHKPELVELLRGDRCRHCGERLVWSRPGAVAFSDGLGAHLACYERAATANGANARDVCDAAVAGDRGPGGHMTGGDAPPSERRFRRRAR